MKLGDLFSKIWYCAELLPEARCNPEYPCLDDTPVCGFRWTVSFIPEDFEPIQELELIRPETIEELAREVNGLADQIVATMLKREPLEIRRERIKRDALERDVAVMTLGEGRLLD